MIPSSGSLRDLYVRNMLTLELVLPGGEDKLSATLNSPFTLLFFPFSLRSLIHQSDIPWVISGSCTKHTALIEPLGNLLLKPDCCFCYILISFAANPSLCPRSLLTADWLPYHSIINTMWYQHVWYYVIFLGRSSSTTTRMSFGKNVNKLYFTQFLVAVLLLLLLRWEFFSYSQFVETPKRTKANKQQHLTREKRRSSYHA